MSTDMSTSGRDLARRLLPLDGEDIETARGRWRVTIEDAMAFPDQQPLRYAVVCSQLVGGDVERRFALRIHAGPEVEANPEASARDRAEAVKRAIGAWIERTDDCTECPDQQLDPVTGELTDYAVGIGG